VGSLHLCYLRLAGISSLSQTLGVYETSKCIYVTEESTEKRRGNLGQRRRRMILQRINSDSCIAERKGFSAIAKTMIIYGIISILLHGLVLSAPVLAGTENGEFCPTCPDWNDLDGWLAKKAAYDQEQQNVNLQGQQITLKSPNADQAPVQNANTTVQSNYSPARTGKFAEALVPPRGVSP
jgi:hypothetical protein